MEKRADAADASVLFLAALAALDLTLVSDWLADWVTATLEF